MASANDRTGEQPAGLGSSPHAGRMPPVARPEWSSTLRALREASGITQDAWAGLLGYGRKTVQRWEGGESVPDARAEAAIIGLCQEHGLFRANGAGRTAAAPTAQALRQLLAAARLAGHVPAELLADSADTAPPAVRGLNLPAPLTTFIDRTIERYEIGRLIVTHRLVTLRGPGGVGKTRLALAVAEDVAAAFPDGVAFVDLAPLTMSEYVCTRIARTLDVREIAGQPLETTLAAQLRARSMLLVLDNFEHLLGAADLLTRLLSAAPGLRLLVTSRTQLNLRGEQEFVLPSLPVPAQGVALTPATAHDYAAVQLFVDRARAVRRGFTLTAENCDELVQICRRLDGLPLAIELSAARLTVLSTAGLLGRLARPLQIVGGGSRDLPSRHRALDETIRWSYDLLDPEQQRLFAWLGVFSGGCTLAAAEAVCGEAAASVIDGVQALVEMSLLQRDDAPDGEPRFRMYETVREFAAERLATSNAERAARDAHLQYFRRLPATALAITSVADEVRWQQAMAAEIDNFRAALSWSLTGPATLRDGLVLAGGLAGYWAQGHLSEGCAWLSRLIAADVGPPTSPRAHALYYLGQFQLYLGGRAAALATIEECVRVSRALGHDLALANGLSLLATVKTYTDEGLSAAEEAVSAAQRSGQPTALLRALYTLGAVAFWHGDLDRAQPAAAEAVRWGQGTPLHRLTAAPLRELGNIAYRRGDLPAARSYLEESLNLLQETESETTITQTLASLARAALAEGQLDEAAALYARGHRHSRAVSGASYYPLLLSGQAALAFAQGELEHAARLFGAAEATGEEVGWPLGALYRDEHAATIAELQSHLDAERFARAWARGRRTTTADLLNGAEIE